MLSRVASRWGRGRLANDALVLIGSGLLLWLLVAAYRGGALQARLEGRWLLPAFGAFLVSHLAAVVIAYPWTYGCKTILPVQYLFLFCSFYAVAWPWTRRNRAIPIAER